MKYLMQVDIGQGPIVFTTTLSAVVEWERKMNRRSSTIATQGIGIEDIAFMAYATLKEQGEVVLPPVFDDFVKRLIDIEVLGEGDPRPLKADTDTP